MTNNIPEAVKNQLLYFLSDLPVEKYTDDWRAIQIAIAMITAPNSFKKGVHVYMSIHSGGREEGAFDNYEFSLKIWPNKIQVRLIDQSWNSWEGYVNNYKQRFIYPSDKYNVADLKEILSNVHPISCESFVDDTSDMDGTFVIYSKFKIETNVK